MNAIQAEKEKTRDRDATLYDLIGAAGPMMAGGSSLLPAAHALYVLSLERPKKDFDREPEYQERNWSRIRDAQERLQRSYDPGADRALLRYLLVEASKLPAGQRIEALDKEAGFAAGMSEAEAGRRIDALCDRLFAGTKLGDKATRLALLDKSTAEILAAKDPMIDLAVALNPLWRANRERAKTREGAYDRLGRALRGGDAREERRPHGAGRECHAARDARRASSASRRETGSSTPADDARGRRRKGDGRRRVQRPEKGARRHRRRRRPGRRRPYADPKLGDVPVNFLSTVDITGGNSGSATLNAKGELCGLVFDGTYDTVASDFMFDTLHTRSIHVDSRYMLWTMSEVGRRYEPPEGDRRGVEPRRYGHRTLGSGSSSVPAQRGGRRARQPSCMGRPRRRGP